MWMPDESAQSPVAGSGLNEVAGQVERAPQQQPVAPGGLLGGRREPILVFRIRTDAGESLHCRFEGTLSGLVDRGDRVLLRGSMVRGVFHAAQILDEHGSVVGRSSCFVATVVCGDPRAPEAEFLRLFRERVLRPSAPGRAFLRLYWRVGPILASRLHGRPRLCRLIRMMLLSPLCHVLKLWLSIRSVGTRAIGGCHHE